MAGRTTRTSIGPSVASSSAHRTRLSATTHGRTQRLADPALASLIPDALLYLAILSRVLPRTAVAWPWILGISLGAGLWSGLLAPIAVLPLGALALASCALGREQPRFGRIVGRGAFVAVVVLSLALGLHAFPGFQNVRIAQDLVLSSDAAPFTLYWNVDNALCGLLLLGLCDGVGKPSADGYHLRVAVPVIAVALIAMVMPLGGLLDDVRFDPKLPELLLGWIPANRLITSVREEAFFRGLIQHRLSAWLGPRLRGGHAAAIGISAALFGVAHFAGGAIDVFLAFVAGLGYGLADPLTGCIEASILTHFLLNLTHLRLPTYPHRAQLDPGAVAGC